MPGLPLITLRKAFGFGPTGPYSERPAYDSIAQGLCEALECTELLEREGMRNVGERIDDTGRAQC